MRNILLFIDSLGAGGAQRQLAGLAVLLKNAGYKVNVITYFDLPFYKFYLDENGVDVEHVVSAQNSFKRIWTMRRAINRYNPDVVISYLETPSIVACVCKLLGDRWRLIVSERNTTQKNNWREWIRFQFFRFADVIVPNSFSQAKFIDKYYSFLNRKVKTIINFTDTDVFKASVIPVKRDVPEIVIAASIWPPKNTLGFIRAVEITANQNPNFHISWYGKPKGSTTPYINECEALIKELGVEKYITLCEKTQQIKDKYCGADFFCLPSFYEGTPNVICEAISCSRPIICSDVCDNAIYVKEGVNGFLFNPELPADMARKLLQALEIDSDTYARYCEQSRKMAVELLSSKRFVKQYIEII